MRVLHVSHSFITESATGVEVFLSELLPSLSELGVDVSLYHGTNLPGVSGFKAEDSIWNHVPLRKIERKKSSSGKLSKFYATLYDEEVEEDFKRYVKDKKPDVIHFHHVLNLSSRLPFIAKAAGAKVVFTLHDHFAMCQRITLIREPSLTLCNGPSGGKHCVSCHQHRGFKAKLAAIPRTFIFSRRTRHMQRMLQGCDVITHPAHFQEELMFSLLRARQHLRYIPYGIRHSRALSGGKTKPGEKLRLAFLGTIAHHKGLDILVSAVEKLDGSKFAVNIWGRPVSETDPYFVSLKPRLQKPPFHLRGGYKPDEVGIILQEADLVVVPSRWQETGPIVLLEAAAAGVPVVGTRLGGMVERIRDGISGALFSWEDVEGLRKTLRDLEQDRDAIKAYRTQLSLPPEIGDVAKQFKSLYEELKNKSSKRY
ncbi:MAG: glycosyltransferase [Planctomycetes bacterium]|nr:glycosyltransferase [Planctomycetota bacterium]